MDIGKLIKVLYWLRSKMGVVDVVMIRFKICFESRVERICCWFGYELLDKEQIYWVNLLYECGVIYGNGNIWEEVSQFGVKVVLELGVWFQIC